MGIFFHSLGIQFLNIYSSILSTFVLFLPDFILIQIILLLLLSNSFIILVIFKYLCYSFFLCLHIFACHLSKSNQANLHQRIINYIREIIEYYFVATYFEKINNNFYQKNKGKQHRAIQNSNQRNSLVILHLNC